MTLKELFVRIAARAGNLEVLEDPVDGNVPWVPSMVWHRRSNDDPLHQWVRSQILSAARKMEEHERELYPAIRC